ncbi:hypothetical protein QF042_002855 [Pedobacter sp. W3I1]|nr:hypothetical protein [Pedobacter sp. W3I1]
MGDIFVKVGIIVGLLSMLYFSANTTGVRHPNVEDRITNALESINIDDEHICWDIACIGLSLWEEQFDLQFDWLEVPESPKFQYSNLIQQIKTRK